jgi:hypothetical protein
MGCQLSSACSPLLVDRSLSNNEDKFFTDWEETFDSFDAMGLHENLLRGIYAYGEQLLWAGCQELGSCTTRLSGEFRGCVAPRSRLAARAGCCQFLRIYLRL